MAGPSYRPPSDRSGLLTSGLVGLVVAAALFVLIALAQRLGEVDVPERRIEEQTLRYEPPEVEKIEEPPPEEKEPPPEELEERQPRLSLDQLDIALDPGTGGSLAGDFALPDIASAADLGTRDFVNFAALDRVPRPVGVSGLNFPRRLRREPVEGKIVLLLKLSEEGEVLDLQVESSNLPRFDDFVKSQVKNWKFTPPRKDGQPVRAQARLPIPIRIR